MSWKLGDEAPVIAGPWGGNNGTPWDDGVYSAVRQIIIGSSAGINFIQFEYDEDNHSIWCEKHGGIIGVIKTDKIKLNYPTEFLISIGGTCGSVTEGGGPVIVTSLCFESNLRTYGPFGVYRGTPFALAANTGMLQGFYGRSSSYLDSIGVYVKPLTQRSNMLTPKPWNHFDITGGPMIPTAPVNPYPHSSKKVVSFGPWGGDSGTVFDDGIYTGVQEIQITRSGGLVSIRVCYDHNGRAVWGKKNGGSAGLKLDKIVFDYPFEVLSQISGYYGSTILRGATVIKSLTFHTNKRTYGPFGDQEGFSFSSGISKGPIIGFHGRNGYFIHSIGVHVLETTMPLLKLPSYPDPYNTPLSVSSENIAGAPMMSTARVNPYPHSSKKNHFDIAGGPMMSTARVNPYPHSSKKVVSFGPWGGDSGTIFDDGIYTGVREIQITRSGGLVSIRVCYDHNGRAVWGKKNGGSAGLKLDKIVFDYPFEVLCQISGYYGSTILRGPTVIKSLTFHTNRRTYGPFGDQQGFSFSSGISKGPIIGFHGRNGYFIHSIGVHVLETTMPLLIRNITPLYPDPCNTPLSVSSEVAWGLPREQAPYLTRSLGDEGGRPWEGVPRKPVNPYESGPWGGEGGKPWDDGVYRGVRKILLTRGDAICSAQFENDLNGRFVWSPVRGKAKDDCTYQIKFDYPHEVLTSISGYYDTVPGDMPKRVIRSLTFHTNRTKYGPHGKTIGTYFSSANKDGKVVGFHGRSSYYLDAIGVHMQYWANDETSQRYPSERGSINAFLQKMLP